MVPGIEREHEAVRAELLDRFGGVTVWSRSPARGLWKPDAGRAETDDIVVYEVQPRASTAAGGLRTAPSSSGDFCKPPCSSAPDA